MVERASPLSRTFQLSQRLPARRASELRETLSEMWNEAIGSPPGILEDDLDLLRRRFFDPVAQGKRLREQLGALPVRPRLQLPDPLWLEVGSDRAVITPEGRAALELLASASRSPDGVALDERQAADLELLLLDKYRDWSRHRIDQVIGLLGNEALRPPAIGLLLTLLVNRSIGRSRAVLRYSEGPERDAIDEAFRGPVARFAQVIDPKQRRSAAKERLVSGWTLHEITRRYPKAIAIDEDGPVSRVYVAEGAESELLDAVARALARKHVGTKTAGEAFDELVAAFRTEGKKLAAYSMLYERPSDTAQLRTRLLDALRKRQQDLQEA